MDARSFAERYGPCALVTGAAEGLGACFAEELARRGCDLLLVDRQADRLGEAARSLSRDHGVAAEPIVADLASPEDVASLLERARQVDLGLFVSNAAISWVGSFADQPLETALAQLDVNCRAPLVLTHGLLPRLRARGRGGILLLSSLSAMRGTALVASYAATKAFALSLGESLWEELRAEGVDVLAVLPGSTRTPGWLASNPQSGLGTVNVMQPMDVAREALDGLGSGPSLIIGQANRDADAAMAGVERRQAVTVLGEVMRAMYPPDRKRDPSV